MRNPTEHFYNEIYSYYYNVVGKLINNAIKWELTPEKEREILYDNSSFSDDLILDKLHIFNEWFLMRNEMIRDGDKHYYETNIECEYERPLSILEKRWLKSIVLDPRIQLFDIGLEDKLTDIDPLFEPSDFMAIGMYNDGDDYGNEVYKSHFKTILKAIKEGWGLQIVSENIIGEISTEPYLFMPEHIEYSEVEDKFSVYGYSPNEYGNSIVRVGRIESCRLCARQEQLKFEQPEKEKLRIILNGHYAHTQNVLERILIEFSHYEKSVRENEDGDYLIELKYYRNEEKELTVLRLMPFAQYIRVISPRGIRNEIKKRIENQNKLLRFFPNYDVQ